MNDTLFFGPFCLATSKRLLTKQGIPIAIGGRALDLLIAMIERAGEIICQQDLRRLVWPNVTVDDASLRVQISALRRTLRDGKDGARYVVNIPGRGYSFVAKVEIPTLVPVARLEPRLPPNPAVGADAASSGENHDSRIDGDAEFIASIRRRLDGLPLAMAMVANRLEASGTNGVANLLDYGTIKSLIDSSFELLTTHEKNILCRLSVFGGPFTLEAAQLVCQDMNLNGEAIYHAMTSLADRCLVMSYVKNQKTTYKLLDATRTHIAAKIAELIDESASAQKTQFSVRRGMRYAY
jgi:DNA-binding winged helix-turn-helix (wHTH) protein